MPRIPVDVDAREYSEALKARGDQPWRKVILEALGIDETPRRLGRPRRMVSHDVLCDSAITDSHRVEGFDSFAEDQEKLLERMRRKKAGGL